MRPRSLMVPPGMPDFLTRERIVEAGRALLEGRAWSGTRAGRRGGGERRRRRDLGARPSSTQPVAVGVARWTYRWDAASRARTSSAAARATRPGTCSRVEPEWNLGGYANNAVQRVPVTVA